MAANKSLLLITILLVFFLVACKEKTGIDFYVTNQRDTVLQNVNLSPGKSPVIISYLKPGETKKVFMDFSGAAKVDGCYQINIDNAKNKDNNLIFGYYSNGIPLEKEMRIAILNDTFQITAVFRDGY
jgi:hypothetical protein